MIALFAAIMIGAPDGAVGAVAPAAHKSAIIVGVNEPFESSQPTLRYADDDAARFFEMLSSEAEHLELLARLDNESQSLFRSAAAAARVPDHATLVDALARAEKASARAREQGRRTELYFIYTGHGRVEGGEGEVKLSGGALTRTELTERVLKSRGFDRIHVIIDACNAYHLVSARGDADAPVTTAFDAEFDRFVEEHALDRFPAAGFVLSTSGAGATHEWSRYQGGVFSHEIRSALAGAADANEDKRVDYTEMEAFLASANMKVPELKGRPKVFVRAPALEREAALYAPSNPLPELELPATLAGHFFVEDDRGIRYAELNKAEGHPVLLRLVPRGRYQLVRAGGGEVTTVEASAMLMRVSLPIVETPLPNVARGDEAPSGAFAEAFGPRFVDGFRAAHQGAIAPELAVDTSAIVGPKLRVASWVAVGVGALAIAGSIWQATEAGRAYREYDLYYDIPNRDRITADVRTHRARATGLGILGGVALAGAITVFTLDLVD